MPIIFHHQANFTSGELSPRLTSRLEFTGYERGAAKLRNVLVIPQGGLRRRFGTKFVSEVTNISFKDELKFVVLEFNESPRYLMVFTPLLITVFLVPDDNVTTQVFTLPSPYLSTQIKDLNFTQDTNVLVIMHEDHRPALLRRLTSLPLLTETGWNANTNDPVLASGVGEQGNAYRVNTAGNTVLDGATNWLVDEWAWFNFGAWRKLQPLPPNEPWELVNATFKFFPTFDFKKDYDSAIFLPENLGGANNTITINNPGSTLYRFSPDLIGGIFTGNGGTMRITALGDVGPPPMPPSNEVLKGDTIQTFTGDGALDPQVTEINGKTVLITEPAFSDTLGWPKSGTFFQRRLWFGGSKALPQGIFASQINDFFDFDNTAGVATDSIFDFLGGGNIIRHIIGTKSLVVFTTSAEFSTQIILEDGVTPQNVSFLPQTHDGASNAEPVATDNQIIFVDRGGQIIRNMIYDSQTSSYGTNDISLISSQLIDKPVSSSLFKGHTQDDSTYLFLVNEGTPGTDTEGSIAAFQTLQSQSIAAWTLLTTKGKFLQTTGATNVTFFFVEREGKFHIEQLDFSLLLDAATVRTLTPPTNLIQDLNYLNNQLVRVIGDGIILNGPQDGLFPVGGNSILLDEAVTNVVIGLDFTPVIETLPINVNTQLGPNLYLPKTIIRVFVDFFESLGIEVNGFPLPNLTFSDNFVTPPKPRSGVEELKINTGYGKDNQVVTITQSLPFPMTIRAIGLEVDI